MKNNTRVNWKATDVVMLIQKWTDRKIAGAKGIKQSDLLAALINVTGIPIKKRCLSTHLFVYWSKPRIERLANNSVFNINKGAYQSVCTRMYATELSPNDSTPSTPALKDTMKEKSTDAPCTVWQPSYNGDSKCDEQKKLNIDTCYFHEKCYKMYRERIWNEGDTIEYYKKYFRLTWSVVHLNSFKIGCACNLPEMCPKCVHNDWFYRVDGENKPATIAQLFESAFCCIDIHNQKYCNYIQGQAIYSIRGGIDNAKEIIKSHQKFILEFLGKGILSTQLENELKVRHSFNCPIAQSPLTIEQRRDLYQIARTCYISALNNWTTIICDVENKGILCATDKFTGRLADSCEGVFRSYASYLQTVLQPLLAVFVSFFLQTIFFLLS